MDIVKKEKIYKGAETLGAERETERETQKPAEPQIIQQRRFQEDDDGGGGGVPSADSDFEKKV